MNRLLAGMDEVGMGCLAGPIAVAVTVFDRDEAPIEGVTDSKRLTPKKRERLFPQILERAVWVGLGWASSRFVDLHGVTAAWNEATEQALHGMPVVWRLAIDGMRKVGRYTGQQVTVVKGDASDWMIGAASIVAKVARDHEMARLGNRYPTFNWRKNAGYGSAEHYSAILTSGVTRLHRTSFLTSLLGRSREGGSEHLSGPTSFGHG